MKLWSDSWVERRAHPGAPCRRPPRHAPSGVDLLRQRQPAPGLERPAGGHALARPDLPRLRRAEPRRRRQPGRPRDPGRPAAGRLLPLAAGRPAAGRELAAGGRLQPGLHGPRQAGPGGRRAGLRTARQGINDYTGWFAGNPAMAGDYYGYDGPFPPWNDSLVHHYVFTLYALAVARAPVEGRVRRRRAAPGDLSGTCWPRPRTREPTRSTAACSDGRRHRGARPSAAGHSRSAPGAPDAHRRRAPRRDGVERRDAHAGPARHRPQRARPLAGGARRRGAGRRGHRGDLRQRPGARLRHRAGAAPPARPADRAPTSACASAASACSRATPMPRSIGAGRPRRRAGGATIPSSRPRAARAWASSAPARSRPAARIAAGHARPLDRRRHPRRRARLPVPRRRRRRARRAALVGARQRRDQPAALHRRAASPWSAGATPRTSKARHARRRQRGRLPAGAGRAGAAMSTPAEAFVPKVGDPVAAIDTPALVIDLDAMERNLAAMADFARARNVRLRPHAKMHKCAAIARLQREAGAVGVCVQKTSEAEALAAAGVDDIYISNEVIDRAKLARVAALATRVRLAIAVDSLEGIERLAGSGARGRRDDRRVRRGRRRPRPLRRAGRRRRLARPSPRRACAARRRPALRRPAGVPRRGPAPARRGRAGGGVAPRGVAGARGAGEHQRRRHRLPARSPAPAPALSPSTSRAASGASCRPAATCSWTATTPTTRRRRTRRASSMRSSSRAR